MRLDERQDAIQDAILDATLDARQDAILAIDNIATNIDLVYLSIDVL